MNKTENGGASRLLRPYMRRMRRLALLRAGLWGCCAGAAAYAVVLILCRCLHTDKVLWPLLAALVGLLIGTAVTWWIVRPTEKKTARLLDALGLQERTATMLALHKDESEIAALQREDAMSHVREVRVNRLKEAPGLLLPLVIIAAAGLVILSSAMPEQWFTRTAIAA